MHPLYKKVHTHFQGGAKSTGANLLSKLESFPKKKTSDRMSFFVFDEKNQCSSTQHMVAEDRRYCIEQSVNNMIAGGISIVLFIGTTKRIYGLITKYFCNF